MRALKAVTIAMAVLIVLATALLGVLIARRMGDGPPAAGRLVLAEPAGTRIVAVGASAAGLAVQLQGGGPDRVVLIDPRTLTRTGVVSLAH